MKTNAPVVRIGMVNYINVAPIYEVWKEKHHPDNWHVVEGSPSTLNQLLARGEIDLGFVSSFAYAIHPERYQIFSGLSISATGPVGSVFLFSRVPIEELDAQIVMLTKQSDTSIRLVKIILEEFYQIHPSYLIGEVFGSGSQAHKATAVLAIGDDALRIKESNIYPFNMDLGEAWNRHTGLPFVFSVCAVRRELITKEPEEARGIQNALLNCRQEGSKRMVEICERVSARIPMECSACSRYLQAIEHDLSPVKIRALEQFFTFLIGRKEASEKALPLQFFS